MLISSSFSRSARLLGIALTLGALAGCASSTPALTPEPAAPFAIGWFAVAPFVGALRNAALGSPRAMLARTALAWLLAWPVGLGLRALIRQTSIPISFAIVTLITNMVILLGWRGIFAWLTARRKDT